MLGARLLPSSQNVGSFLVSTPGKNTTNRMTRISSAETTKIGFFRSDFQASWYRLVGAVSVVSASVASSGVSSEVGQEMGLARARTAPRRPATAAPAELTRTAAQA